jgi:hypothetical protein
MEKTFIEIIRASVQQQEKVRQEINLAKWPQIFSTKNTPGMSREIIRGDAKVTVGKQLNSKGQIVEVGLLSIMDFLVLHGLIQLWELKRLETDQDITCTVPEFIKYMLKRPMGGKQLLDLERSLRRLVNIPVNWENAFFDSRTSQLESITDYTFRFLQELKIKKRREEDGKLEFKTFACRFNTSFARNLIEGKTKPIYFKELRSLRGEMSVLAYSFLDLVMSKRRHWERRVQSFIQEDLAITGKRYKKRSLCVQEVQKIADELKGRRLTTGIISNILIRKTNDGNNFKLVVVKTASAELPKREIRRTPALVEAEQIELVEKLILSLGRARNKLFYEKIVRRCPRDLVNIALRDTIDADNAGAINTSRAAYFGDLIKRLAQSRGIDLGLKSDKVKQAKNQQG